MSKRETKRFKAELLSGHKDGALEVPFDPAELWNIKAKPLWKGRRGFQVEATINGVQFETAIVPRQTRFYMLVPDDIARAAIVAEGDIVSASVRLATD